MRRLIIARGALAVAAMAAVSAPAMAQDALAARLSEGGRLVAQSCGVCHTKPTLSSKLFGPVLSKATFAKGDDQPKSQIANGSPNMPGFKYQFTPAQIDAIVAYLKTREPPAAVEPAKATNSGGTIE